LSFFGRGDGGARSARARRRWLGKWETSRLAAEHALVDVCRPRSAARRTAERVRRSGPAYAGRSVLARGCRQFLRISASLNTRLRRITEPGLIHNAKRSAPILAQYASIGAARSRKSPATTKQTVDTSRKRHVQSQKTPGAQVQSGEHAAQQKNAHLPNETDVSGPTQA
jgi:hypothetical protein